MMFWIGHGGLSRWWRRDVSVYGTIPIIKIEGIDMISGNIWAGSIMDWRFVARAVVKR